MRLPEAVKEALDREAAIRDNPFIEDYSKGWADGVAWFLGMLEDCDDLEIEELT